jgi:hypothetical protein
MRTFVGMVGGGGGTYVLYVQILVDHKGNTLAWEGGRERMGEREGEKEGRRGREGRREERVRGAGREKGE